MLPYYFAQFNRNDENIALAGILHRNVGMEIGRIAG